MNQGNSDTKFLVCRDEVCLAYHYTPGTSPGVIFLTGFKSDMTGDKALFLEDHCRKRGHAFLRFDYEGHGRSSGKFEAGCIGQWARNVVQVVDCIAKGSQILVGSSMGGWLMLLTAMQRKDRVVGLLGLAAAPDFTEDLMWNKFSDKQREELQSDGSIEIPNCHDVEPYLITQHLINEGRNHLMLRDTMDLDLPVRLIHGMVDEDVPWETALKISAQLSTNDVEVQLVKDSGHRLSGEHDLARLAHTLDSLIEHVQLNETQGSAS